MLRFGLVLLLGCQLVVWEAFLVGARPFGLALPVAAVLAGVANLALGLAGARALGSRTGAVVPGVLWLACALVLSSRRAEGDVIVPNTGRGTAFLLVGTLAAAAVVGAGGRRRAGPAAERP